MVLELQNELMLYKLSLFYIDSMTKLYLLTLILSEHPKKFMFCILLVVILFCLYIFHSLSNESKNLTHNVYVHRNLCTKIQLRVLLACASVVIVVL